ncbi:DapH/DapD/GlmU-related protein [Nitrosopumilus sp.]|uniref:DapH/DapD/GlmU-related protein n=1 Tax=Nitrosopumilus sp. TaxID=2024843 RepID=UPI003D0C6EDE
MYTIRKNNISVKAVADFLDISYSGPNFFISSANSLNNISDNSVLFYAIAKDKSNQIIKNMNYDLKKLKQFKNIILITNATLDKTIDIPILFSKNPKLDFYRVILEFFSENNFKNGIHPSSVIEDGAILGKDVYVGSHCYIGNNVKIGNNTKVFDNTCIYGETEIGSNCVIKSNTTIGSEGFGFIPTDDGLFHLPHVGSILIGNDVWIGSNSTVEKSHLDQTIIEDDVKIDDLVQIGHNTIIKQSTQITSGCVIVGRVKIGKNCWISPHCVIDVGCELGDNCIVGTSSLVRTNFSNNSVIVGSPGRLLRKNESSVR